MDKVFICPQCGKKVKAHKCVLSIFYKHQCSQSVLKKKKGRGYGEAGKTHS